MSEAPIEWMTVEDVARHLDLKPKTIYLLASARTPPENRLPSHRLGPRGGKLRFHPDDLAAYIKTRREVIRPSEPPRPYKHLFQPRRVTPSPRRS